MVAFDLIIFDCDGVLVDSEIITNRVFAAMLGELGLEVTLEVMFEHFVGHSMQHCMGLVKERLGSDVPLTFEAEFRARIGRALADELQPVSGIYETLRQLAIPVCVASNGEREKMRMTLALTGLLERFEGRIFSALDVLRGKPAPDVFLLAASAMGVAPSRCVVVEDTPVGVSAGVAAGMTVLGYANRTPARRLRDAGAAVVFSDMRELPALVSRLSNQQGNEPIVAVSAADDPR
jgi:HAD superfamily hydrolase (TIGR01509 family)